MSNSPLSGIVIGRRNPPAAGSIGLIPQNVLSAAIEGTKQGVLFKLTSEFGGMVTDFSGEDGYLVGWKLPLDPEPVHSAQG